MTTEVESTEPAEETAPDQQAISLSKHLAAWRESHGDKTVDEAIEADAARRKAAAGQARAEAGQKPSAAPTGRSSSPKSNTSA